MSNSDINKNRKVKTTSSELVSMTPQKILKKGGKDLPSKVDPLYLYLKEISRYQLLTPAEERKLTLEFAETGDIEIAKKLVTANLRLVVKIAMEYRQSYHNILDLIQEGNIGLMKAVSKYDPHKGAKLSYYASWWIKSYILKYILDHFRIVKIGTTAEQKKLFFNLMREKERLTKLGIEPTTTAISENLGVSEKAVVLMEQKLGHTGGDISLEKPVFEDQTATVGDNLFAEEDEVDDVLAKAQEVNILKKNLKDFVGQLKERDKDIFKKRLLSEVPPSLQAIADEYGVTRERIRQIEERLVKKLKVYMSEFIR